jgi:ABC-type multidrug transport system fused ATPase/permease subunit
MFYKRKTLVIFTLGLSILEISFSLFWNSQVSTLVNLITARLTIPAFLILKAVITMGFCAGISYGVGVSTGWTAETMTHDLRMGYARYCIKLSPQEMLHINSGEYLSKLQNEISEITGYLSSSVFPIICDMIRFLGAFSFMVWLNPKLAFGTQIPVVFIMGYTVITSKVIGNAALKSQQANEKMNGYLDTLISAFPVLKLFQASSYFISSYSKVLQQWENNNVKEERVRAKLMTLSALISSLPLVILFLLGGYYVIHEEISLGTLYIFINLSGIVSSAMMNMPGRIGAFRRFTVNLARLKSSVILD